MRLDPEADWDSIVKDVAEKFKSSAEFWGDAKKAIAFQGRELDEKQQDEILATIQDNCELQIVCVLDENPEREAAFAKALQQEKSGSASAVAEKTAANMLQNDNGTGFFFKGNLRSGQVLDVETSIIVIGDVKVGAKVVSKGNVIILGTLEGTVYAGSTGNTNAFVIALDMNPMQIKIADVIARAPDKPARLKKRHKPETKIAFLEDENIYIEPLDKDVMNDIKL